jgi:SAM-dependent methyltransferase
MKNFFLLSLCALTFSYAQDVDDYSCKKKSNLMNLVKEENKEAASEILDECFHTSSYTIFDEKGKNNHGRGFAIEPEFMVHLMRGIEGKKVLELGGARGYPSLLMGLAGALEVMLNDINKKEIEYFNDNCQKIFEKNKKFKKSTFKKVIFDINKLVKYLSENNKKFDVVIMRNVLHFFNEKYEKEFFDNIKNIMNDNAQLYLVTNREEISQKKHSNTQNTYYKHKFLVMGSLGPCIHHFSHKMLSKNSYAITEQKEKEAFDSTSYTNDAILYFEDAKKCQTKKKLVEKFKKNYHDKFQENPTEEMNCAVEKVFVEANGISIQAFKRNYFNILKNQFRCFSPNQLKETVVKYGFEVDKIAAIELKTSRITEDESKMGFSACLARFSSNTSNK